jgi:hypothetical protein
LLSFGGEVDGLFLSLICPGFTYLLPLLSQWLSFHHRAFNQNPDQHQDEVRDPDQRQSRDLTQSSLRKVVEISDLFRFISEFVLSGVSDLDSEDSGSESKDYDSAFEIEDW